MILQVALLACLVIVASGNLCCPRNGLQFSAFQDITFTNSSTTMRGLYFFVYDGVNQKYIVGDDRIATNFVGTGKTIYDYQTRTGYKIDSKARTCTKFPLQGNFEDQENICVPSGAVTLGPLFYGYNIDTLHARTYTYNSTTADGRQHTVYSTVTEDCVPIFTTKTTTGGPGGNSLYLLAYNNVFPGIKDMSVFDIPSYC
ncbi:ependymin-related protein 1-like [Haliotis asinina]|uniref:ependymin-related protein 1-like n=1 Tax=Haliotis asinina TaxID=109174 RepID=UPI0035327E9C